MWAYSVNGDYKLPSISHDQLCVSNEQLGHPPMGLPRMLVPSAGALGMAHPPAGSMGMAHQPMAPVPVYKMLTLFDQSGHQLHAEAGSGWCLVQPQLICTMIVRMTQFIEYCLSS